MDQNTNSLSGETKANNASGFNSAPSKIDRFWSEETSQQSMYLRPVINFNSNIIGSITFNDNDSAENRDAIKKNIENLIVDILSEANNSVGSR